MTHTDSKGSPRAGGLLFFAFLGLLVHMGILGMDGSVLQALMVFAFAAGFLVWGGFLAFTKGRLVARSCAVLCAMCFGLHLLGSAAIVFTRALRTASSREIAAETEKLDTEVQEALDSSDPIDAFERTFERRKEANDRLATSANPLTATMAKALKLQEEMTEGPLRRLIDVARDLESERYIDVVTMVEEKNFAWHLAVSREYDAAAKGVIDSFDKATKSVETYLETTVLSKRQRADFVKGMSDAVDENRELYAAHGRVALAYIAYFEFVELNQAGLRLEEDIIVIDDEATMTAHDALVERVEAASADLIAKQESARQRFASR